MTGNPQVTVSEAVRLANGKLAISVEGRPFITLGAQFRADRWLVQGGYTLERLSGEGVIGWAKALNCNTVQIPIPWREIEPEQERYDWSFLAWCVAECRKYALRMEIVWFGSNVCGAGWHNVTPHWLNADPGKYTRMMTADGRPLGEHTVHHSDGQKYTFCVENPDLLEAECRTVGRMMDYLLDNDPHHTVIGFQVENEPSLVQHNPALLEIDRCHCARCNALYAESGCNDAMEFSRISLTRYLDRIGSAVKRSRKSMYTRVNWISPYWDFDEDTGKVVRDAPHLDFVGYDTYGRDQREIYRLLTGDLSMDNGNIPHLGELEGGLHGCAEKIVDLLAANGYGVSVYQLTGYTDGDDNYLLDPHGADARDWTDEVRRTYGMLGKAQALLATRRHGDGDEIQFFNCMGQTDRRYEGAKIVSGHPVSYGTDCGGIGIALALGDDGLVLMSAKSGVFTIDAPDDGWRCEEGFFGPDGTWQQEEDMGVRLQRDRSSVRLALRGYEVVRLRGWASPTFHNPPMRPR